MILIILQKILTCKQNQLFGSILVPLCEHPCRNLDEAYHLSTFLHSTEPWWLRGLIEQCSNTASLLAFGRKSEWVRIRRKPVSLWYSRNSRVSLEFSITTYGCVENSWDFGSSGVRISGLYQLFRPEKVFAIRIAERTTMSMIYIPSSNPYPNPQWVRIMVSPVKGALPVRVDSNRRLADGLRGPWLNIDIELWNGLVRSPQL